jgi:hypothetical protein
MKFTFVLAILLCALSFGLGSCGYAPERVEMIAPGDTNFTVYCATTSACRQRATDLCQAQGYPHYDIMEQLKGDEVGEGRGIAIQCGV